MKKQRTKGIVLVVVCFICVMCICSGFHKAQSEELSEIPDAVNSTRFNTTEHLTVVANQEEIADKKELAKQIIKMCRENSFQSIKFSYDMAFFSSAACFFFAEFLSLSLALSRRFSSLSSSFCASIDQYCSLAST